ncbi:meiosis initiator protein [Rhinolophus ferrumequinum]|uniref:meiosis initiator protein n=1 Tax=Rhinolophus ferrumequinum TaxID=59479 RepID=UPI00140F8533|nr:meiosis initiator protein [Rhinolophus ferrumequinum]
MWDSSRYLCSSERPRASSLGSRKRTLLPCSLVEGEVGVSLSEPHGLRVGEGWFPKGSYYQQRTQNQLLSQNRKQRKNHTGKLHELALLLPVALKTGSKKLTKKEILLHVLHYIQYLQRSIDVAQALLKLHTTDGEGGLGGLGQNPTVGPARRRHSTPSSSPHSLKSCLQGACRKPQKKKLTRGLDRRTQAQDPRRCLALDKLRKLVTPSPDQKRGNTGAITTPPRCPDSCVRPEAASSPPQGDKRGGRSWLMLLDVTENSVHCDISSCYCKRSAPDDESYPTFEAQQGAKRIHFLNRTQPFSRQKPVFYDSSEEVDQESPDADPWLPAWTPEGSPHGSPLALGPLQIDNWSVTGLPREILGLSPSLFSSPEKLLPEKILEDGDEYLTQALFEEVFLDPVSSPSACMLEVSPKNTPSEAPKETSDAPSLSQSSVLQDHCYLSLSENSKGPSSPSSEDSDPNTDTESVWKPPEDAEADPKGPQSSSEEDGDYTWTPTRRASTLPAARRRTRKGPASGCPVKSEKTAPCPIQTKKKCVNGFIMFCRMNRKQYIRSCPGTASTAATKELAQLWRLMSEQERKPYSIKARRFSRRHNRIVKQESSSSEDEDWGTPKPFYQLLAEKARCSSKPAPLPPRRRK